MVAATASYRPRLDLLLASIFVLTVFVSGCQKLPGLYDLSGLTVARYNEPYQGQIAIEDYSGPAQYSLVEGSGELPPGLELDEAGRVTGTPTYVGTWTFEVLATLSSKKIDDFSDEVSLIVTAEYVEGVFLGYEHDQVNNMTEELGLMTDVWVRVSGGGVEGMQNWTMNPGLYLPGVNGQAERGYEDDVRIGDIAFEELEVESFTWEPTGPVEPYDGHPSAHNPEDEPPVLSGDGTISAGADGGEGTLILRHPDYEDAIETRVLVVPPDWCPKGVDAIGGRGGPSETRYCA